MTRVYMSLIDDGGLSSSSFGNSGSSSGSTSPGNNNVESSSNSSGDETVRHYTNASFGNNESEQQQYNSRHSQHEEEEDVVDRRFSNAALGGEFDINNLTERTTRIISDVRRARWAREAAAKMIFSTGDELHELRSRIAGLRNELVDIKKLSLSSNGPGLSDTTLGRTESTTTDTNIDRHRKKANEMENEIAILNDRDAEFVYAMSSELKKRAVLNGNTDEINEYQCKMEDAMSCIPQMNLHGLWVGK